MGAEYWKNYGYVGNNPLTRIDTRGLWDWHQYWCDVAQVFKGEGEGLISPVTGTIGTVGSLIHGGWRHPIATLIVQPVEGVWGTLPGAYNGDPESAGRIVGTASAIAIGGYIGGTITTGEGCPIYGETNVTLWRYPNTGGGGFNLRLGTDRVFGVDINQWGDPTVPPYKWLHFHIGKRKAHLPWQSRK